MLGQGLHWSCRWRARRRKQAPKGLGAAAHHGEQLKPELQFCLLACRQVGLAGGEGGSGVGAVGPLDMPKGPLCLAAVQREPGGPALGVLVGVMAACPAGHAELAAEPKARLLKSVGLGGRVWHAKGGLYSGEERRLAGCLRPSGMSPQFPAYRHGTLTRPGPMGLVKGKYQV